MFIPAASGNPFQLEHTIDGLEPGATYQFHVASINAAGESDESSWSEEINLGNWNVSLFCELTSQNIK